MHKQTTQRTNKYSQNHSTTLQVCLHNYVSSAPTRLQYFLCTYASSPSPEAPFFAEIPHRSHAHLPQSTQHPQMRYPGLAPPVPPYFAPPSPPDVPSRVHFDPVKNFSSQNCQPHHHCHGATRTSKEPYSSTSVSPTFIVLPQITVAWNAFFCDLLWLTDTLPRTRSDRTTAPTTTTAATTAPNSATTALTHTEEWAVLPATTCSMCGTFRWT